MKEGDTFHRKYFPESPVMIKEIETHIKGSKKIKLDKPIYHLTYPNCDKQDVTMYKENIERQLSFGLWILKDKI